MPTLTYEGILHLGLDYVGKVLHRFLFFYGFTCTWCNSGVLSLGCLGRCVEGGGGGVFHMGVGRFAIVTRELRGWIPQFVGVVALLVGFCN